MPTAVRPSLKLSSLSLAGSVVMTGDRECSGGLAHQPQAQRLLGGQVDPPPLLARWAPALHRWIVTVERAFPHDLLAAQADRAGQRRRHQGVGVIGTKAGHIGE